MDGMLWIWLACMVLLSLLEAIHPQLVAIWFVFGALAALLSTLFGAPIWLQIVIFAGVSLVTLLLTRPLLQKYIAVKPTHTNADRTVGQTAIVTDQINNMLGKGYVSVTGILWMARSSGDQVIDVGTKVRVESIQGVKLIVTPLEANSGVTD